MMNPEDAGRVLAVAAACDRRTVGKTDIAIWANALDGLDPKACAEAVTAHYADPTTVGQYLMPGHIVGRVKTARRDQARHAATQQTLGEIEAATARADAEQERIDQAKRETRQAFTDAIAAKRAREAAEPADDVSPIGVSAPSGPVRGVS